MKKIHSILIGLMVVMTLSSCFTEVDVDIPEQVPKIVVGSFINPEDLFISVVVKSSSPIFTTYEDIEITETLTNATVKLSDGTNEIVIPYGSSEEGYIIEMTQFPIQYGGTYTLTVSVSGYETVTATTSVPSSQTAFLESVVTDVDSTGDEFFTEINYSMRYKWQDPGSETNFYRIFVEETNANGYVNTDKFISDDGSDGEIIQTSGNIYTYNSDLDPAFRAYLINASEDYYLYHRSLQNLTYGDPFSEPTIVYSNVKNGLGCFGGYTATQVVFTD